MGMRGFIIGGPCPVWGTKERQKWGCGITMSIDVGYPHNIIKEK